MRLSIFWGALLSFSTFANTEYLQFPKCGIFVGDGHLRYGTEKRREGLFFDLNRSSLSEVRFYLGSYDKKDPDALLKLRARLKFRVLQKCSFFCEAELISVEKRLYYPEKNEEFYADAKGSFVQELPCLDQKAIAVERFPRSDDWKQVKKKPGPASSGAGHSFTN